MIKVRCSHCEKEYYADEMVSELYLCPHCNEFTIIRSRNSLDNNKESSNGKFYCKGKVDKESGWDINQIHGDKKMKRSKKEIEKELEQLEKCCDWNGFNMKTTPAYKSLTKELIKCSQSNGDTKNG